MGTIKLIDRDYIDRERGSSPVRISRLRLIFDKEEIIIYRSLKT